MSMDTVFYFLLTTLIIKFINYGFKLKKTIYLILWSILVIIMGSCYLIHLNFEFIAISIILIYAGGIFALSLSLIVSINDYMEHFVFYDKKIEYLVSVSIVLFTGFFLYLYHPNLFNINHPYFINEYTIYYFDTINLFNFQFLYSSDTNYEFLFLMDNIFFSDLFILSYFLFHKFSIHLISIALLLTLSPICSIMLINKI